MTPHDEPQPGTGRPEPDEPRPGAAPAGEPVPAPAESAADAAPAQTSPTQPLGPATPDPSTVTEPLPVGAPAPAAAHEQAPAWGTPAAGGSGGPGAPTPGAPGTAGTPAGPAAPGGSGTDGFFDRIRRGGLFRSDDRWVGGVAGGFAERFGLDPLLVRGLLVLSFFLTGVGLVLYGLGWALLPERRDGRIHLQETFRGHFDVAMVGAVAAFLIGIAWGGPWSWWDDSGVGWLGTLFWLAAIGLAVYLVVQRTGRRGSVPPSGAAPSGPVAAGPVPSGPAPVPGPVTPADGSAPFTTGPAPSGVGYTGVVAPYQPAPSAPSAPSAPAAPRPPKGRSGGVGIVFGLILLAGALLLLQDRVSDLFGTDLPFWPTWLGVSVVLLGLGIVVAGLRGRTGGALTAWAIVALVFGTPWLVWDQEGADLAEMVPPPVPGAQLITDGSISVGSISEAEDGFEIRFGDPEIDLTDLDLSGVTPGEPVVVPITMGAGDAKIVVPEGVAVESDVQVGVGTVRWEVDDEDREITDVMGSSIHLESDEVTDAGAVLHLTIQVGAGDITIEEN
ncbi:PspC domain-containing protein [Antribacter sp. KLBMP9083]|uniref:PspC domain-containing protein n=1 Tax=Antribacter soli TaxID=2910976 RepID=A0AA41U8Q4_9MICO|nr:PspC domain-containing protein [Antribacter soli]MCF4122685.1 PspC domain-containing protein [Antribacter soli]